MPSHVCVGVFCKQFCSKYRANNFFHEKFIFFKTKDTKFLSFLLEHCTIKIDVIRYYLQPNLPALKLRNKERKIIFGSKKYLLHRILASVCTDPDR